MNAEEYMNSVLKNEPDTEQYTTKIIPRFRSRRNLEELLTIVAWISKLSDLLDKKKKQLFYGNEKDLVVIPEYIQRFSLDNKERINAERFCANNIRLVHGLVGMIGEAGELAAALVLGMQDGKFTHPLMTNLREELGDIDWYKFITMHDLELDEEDLRQENADKLAKRYEEGKFSEQSAAERKDKENG